MCTNVPASLVFNIWLWVSVPLDSYHPELKLSAFGNWAAPVDARWSVIISSFYMEQEWFKKTKNVHISRRKRFARGVWGLLKNWKEQELTFRKVRKATRNEATCCVKHHWDTPPISRLPKHMHPLWIFFCPWVHQIYMASSWTVMRNSMENVIL